MYCFKNCWTLVNTWRCGQCQSSFSATPCVEQQWVSTRMACVLQGTPTLEELKLQYYHLLIRYHINANNYIDACRCYRAVYESDSIKDDKEKWVPVRSKSWNTGDLNLDRVHKRSVVSVPGQWREEWPAAFRRCRRAAGGWSHWSGNDRTAGLLPAGAAEGLLKGSHAAVAATGKLVCCLQVVQKIAGGGVTEVAAAGPICCPAGEVLEGVSLMWQLQEYPSAALQVLIPWRVVSLKWSLRNGDLLPAGAAEDLLVRGPGSSQQRPGDSAADNGGRQEAGPAAGLQGAAADLHHQGGQASALLPLCRQGTGLPGCQGLSFKELLQTFIFKEVRPLPCCPCAGK